MPAININEINKREIAWAGRTLGNAKIKEEWKNSHLGVFPKTIKAAQQYPIIYDTMS